MKDCDRALSLDPCLQKAILYKAHGLKESKRYLEAIELYDLAKNSEGRDDCLVKLGMFHKDKGNNY